MKINHSTYRDLFDARGLPPTFSFVGVTVSSYSAKMAADGTLEEHHSTSTTVALAPQSPHD
jgi:hypothetical protein